MNSMSIRINVWFIHSPTKICLLGMYQMMQLPILGINCLIQLLKDTISDLHQHLMEEVGPREDFMWFFPDYFAPVAEEVYKSLSCPELSLLTACGVFTKMSDIIETHSSYSN